MNQRITADPKSFKFKWSIADNANNAGISNVKIVVTLKYLKSDSHLPKNTFFICFNDSPSKIMINTFHFILTTISVIKIFKLLSWVFWNIGKRLNYEDKVNFEIYGVTDWLTNNYNTHIAHIAQN